MRGLSRGQEGIGTCKRGAGGKLSSVLPRLSGLGLSWDGFHPSSMQPLSVLSSTPASFTPHPRQSEGLSPGCHLPRPKSSYESCLSPCSPPAPAQAPSPPCMLSSLGTGDPSLSWLFFHFSISCAVRLARWPQCWSSPALPVTLASPWHAFLLSAASAVSTCTDGLSCARIAGPLTAHPAPQCPSGLSASKAQD